MLRGSRFPDDQAEIVFSEVFIECLQELGRSAQDKEQLLAELVRLCEEPSGKHPLSGRLAGWQTLDVLGGSHRVLFKVSISSGVGLIEVYCLAPRRDSEVYAMAEALKASGRLTEEEGHQIWEALGLLEVVVENVGLDGWDYRPPPASEGLIRTVVAAKLLDEETARTLSDDELKAAVDEGWSDGGADPVKALAAAVRRSRGNLKLPRDPYTMVKERLGERCGVVMPRARARCARRHGHPGAHRAAG